MALLHMCSAALSFVFFCTALFCLLGALGAILGPCWICFTRNLKKSKKEIGLSNTIEKIVKKQINIAKKARLNGVVCSGYEAKIIKNYLLGT